MDIPKLHHEDLDAYKVKIEFLALSSQIAETFPTGYSSLSDQLRRASLSIPLNIAEGYGKRHVADRCRCFYDIARGSAHECGAIVDAAKVLNLIERQPFAQAKILLHRIVSMLVKMVK